MSLSATSVLDDASPSPRPSLLELFLIWLQIGSTSFGGGAATQLLIQQHFVQRRHWLTPEDFAEDWAIVQFSPGINLIAMTVLIGRRLGGAGGIAASMVGMLAPSVAITIAMTAIYTQVRDLPQMRGALRGITPALVGLSMAFMWRLLRAPMSGLRQKGSTAVVIGIALIAATVVLTAFGVPVLVSYLVGAVGLGLVYGLMRTSRK